MAGQDLTVNIKTTSDVPQAMDKSKSAVVSFSKQVEDIQKKFSTAFKDIFLGFTAPMVILQGAIQMISSAIAQAKQDAKDGLDLIAKGETVFATTEEKKMAALFKAKKQREDELKLIEAGKQEMTRQFLTQTKEGQGVAQRIVSGAVSAQLPAPSIDQMSKMKNVQDEALDRFLKSPEGAEYAKILAEEDAKAASKDSQKAGSFKGPEGFGTVVGVGANPVMEKMTRQNELMEEIKIILQEQFILNRGGSVPAPFTERVPLTMQKAGLS
jgi:antitoxin (DNA-binding transcriptional repressor) of toxin-antitoxin stability system